MPEGEWLCPVCCSLGNAVARAIAEDAAAIAATEGGTERLLVSTNEATASQHLHLLGEVTDVICAALPCMDRRHAARAVHSPDHHTVILLRERHHAAAPATPPAVDGEATGAPDGEVRRRVLGTIVLKMHPGRGFAELCFCAIRREEQRKGRGSRLMTTALAHVRSLNIWHVLTYADDGAVDFFKRCAPSRSYPRAPARPSSAARPRAGWWQERLCGGPPRRAPCQPVPLGCAPLCGVATHAVHAAGGCHALARRLARP